MEKEHWILSFHTTLVSICIFPDHLNIDIQNYEIEEIDDIITARVEIEQAFNIFHSRWYAKFLFWVAEAYKND